MISWNVFQDVLQIPNLCQQLIFRVIFHQKYSSSSLFESVTDPKSWTDVGLILAERKRFQSNVYVYVNLFGHHDWIGLDQTCLNYYFKEDWTPKQGKMDFTRLGAIPIALNWVAKYYDEKEKVSLKNPNDDMRMEWVK